MDKYFGETERAQDAILTESYRVGEVEDENKRDIERKR